jgi:hypothetical protein
MFKASVLVSVLALLPSLSFAADCGTFEDQINEVTKLAGQCMAKISHGEIPDASGDNIHFAATINTLDGDPAIYASHSSADQSQKVGAVAQCDSRTGKMVLLVLHGEKVQSGYILNQEISSLDDCEPN